MEISAELLITAFALNIFLIDSPPQSEVAYGSITPRALPALGATAT